MMKRLLYIIGAALLAAPPACNAAAAGWRPERAVEIIVNTSPGTGSDATGRLILRMLTEKKLIEVPATVVNKVGGGGAIGLNYLNQHAGDGHAERRQDSVADEPHAVFALDERP